MDNKQLNQLLKFAGLPLVEGDASPQHEENEKKLFEQCCECLSKVHKMCEERLNNPDLTSEHKKQYTDLCECAKHCCDVMEKHLESYK